VHVDEKAIIRYDDLFSRKRFCIVGQEYHLNQAKCLHTNHVQLPNSAPLHVDHSRLLQQIIPLIPSP